MSKSFGKKSASAEDDEFSETVAPSSAERPRRAPPPPKPGAAMRGPLNAPPPRIKPRPMDVLNKDISKSKPLSRLSASPLSKRPPPIGRVGAPPPGGGLSGGIPRAPRFGPDGDLSDSRELSKTKDQATDVSRRPTSGQIVDPTSKPDASGGERRRNRRGFGAVDGKKTEAAPQVQPQQAQAQPRSFDHDYYNLKSQIFNALIDAMDLARVVSLQREDAEQEITTIVDEIISVKGHVMSISEQKRLVDDICDDILGYGPLEPLLARDDIADIMVNGSEQVFIETNGKIELTNIRFRDNAQLLEICQRIVSKVGRRVDESSPICDARLLDGSRVNVIAPPLSIDGASLTIRKFKKDKLKMADLVRFNSITSEAAKVLEIAANVRCNILISGGTGSGKTTLLNCLSSFAADDERIITCEDSAELQLQQPHVVRLETRPPNLEGGGEITMRALVKNCLRMRPERIIVGEVRGPEAFDLLQAMNTGHDGSMSTLHANSPRECLSRLESMITMGGFSLPSKTIREMICSAVNVIVQAQRLRDGSRRITHVSEVLGMEGDTIITQDLVNFKVSGEDARGKLVGQHVSSGIGQPAFFDRARMFNRDVELQDALASMEEDMT